MSTLTPQQQQQVAALLGTTSDAKIAKKLGIAQSAVQALREELKSAAQHKRERVFKAVLLAFPLLFLLVMESLLRGFDYGGNLALFIPQEEAPGLMRINENVGRRYFSASEVLPETSNDVFPVTKAANAYRIFFLGGSSTFGYPYAHNGSMSKMLGQRLTDYFPERKLEIINLGMPAISSFSLLDYAEEILEQQPDALVIYAGHNEFYGALGAGSTESLGASRGFINFYLKLQRIKIMLLLRDGVEKVKGLFASAISAPPESNTLMEQMVSNDAIPYGSATYHRAHEFFRANINEIILKAQQKKVRVLLSEIVSNVREQEPFVSLYEPTTDRAAYQKALAAARACENTGPLQIALARYDSLLQIDAQPAITHFRRARVLEALHEYEEARAAYQRARDLDGLRFRASSDLNKTLHELAQTHNVPLVPMVRAFESESPHGLIGNNLMLEHLHPNLRGYFIMGRAFAESMQQHDFVAEQWPAERARPDSVYWQERGVTPLDEEVAKIRIAVLKDSWPFVPKGKPRAYAYHPRNEFEKIAYASWQREITWEEAHVKLAEQLSKAQKFAEAAREYEALIMETPYNVSPYLRAGLLYLAINETQRAYQRLRQSLQIEETFEANKYVGSILVDRNDAERGVAYLEKAARMNPYDAQTLYNLTGGYLVLGKIEKAAVSLASLEKLPRTSNEVAALKQLMQTARASQGSN